MSGYEIIACTECGEQTIAARPVCGLCEADKGLFAPPPAPPTPADPEFARWWMTPDSSTGHAPSASLDLGSAQKAWAAARAVPAPAPRPNCPMKAFLDRLNSPDPAVRAEAEAQAERAVENVQRSTPRAEALPAAQAVKVPGGTFEPVGNAWHERVNDEYHATLDGAKVSDGEPLYRFVAAPAGAVAAPAGEDGLDADDITRLREALNWMGESTYESHEECSIFRLRLIRRLISATLTSRDAMRAARDAEVAAAAAGMFKDHEIRDFVNRLRDVAIQFHHAQQLRSRIQEIVLPLLTRDRTA